MFFDELVTHHTSDQPDNGAAESALLYDVRNFRSMNIQGDNLCLPFNTIQEVVPLKVRITQALVSVAFLFSFASAQQPAQPAAVPAAGTAADAQATVYVYRYKQFVGSALSPSVYCDETELARMDNGRFFVAKLAPGKHAFRSNDKQAGVEVELKPGEEYYIRVELATGMMKGHGRLVVATPEQGSYEIKKLKPLDQDRVKDTQHVAAVSPEAK